MGSQTQQERYKKLITFIDEHFKEEINIGKIEAVSHYSYRNINRIFQAIHQETIGKYIKRLRLEKSAQYLLYSQLPIADIALEVGFEDRAAFSKAFKKRYGLSPAQFRSREELQLNDQRQEWSHFSDEKREKLAFEIAYLPQFDYLFLEYRGDPLSSPEIESTWDKLYKYAIEESLIFEKSIPFMAIIDDEQISDQINSRYHCGISLEKPLNFVPEGLIRTSTHQPQKYAKFIHQGSSESSLDFYNTVFAFWMEDVDLELADLPVLEFYPNFSDGLPVDQLITEVYIAVI